MVGYVYSFTAQYFHQAETLGSTLDTGIVNLSPIQHLREICNAKDPLAQIKVTRCFR